MGRCAVTRYLLDTNVWIHLMRNRPPEVRQRFGRLAPGTVVMSPVVLGELHLGWRKSAQRDANRELLERYAQTAQPDPIDHAVAATYGELRADLEARGLPIGANDLWIAAQALCRDFVLVTHNVAEFGRIARLKLEDWVGRQPSPEA
jgi:tRNA(fMet)-specific endonuclease VapC